MKDDYPLVDSDKREKEKLLSKLKLYKIKPEPDWIYRAIGTFYIIAESKKEAEEIADSYIDASRLFGREATWKTVVTEVNVSKNVIEKLLVSEKYTYNGRDLDYRVDLDLV